LEGKVEFLVGKVEFLVGKVDLEMKCASRVRKTVKGGEIRPGANVSRVFGKVKGATGSLLPDSRKSRQPLALSHLDMVFPYQGK
jgi:hypothetical protein